MRDVRALAERCANTLEKSEKAALDWIRRMRLWLEKNEGVSPVEMREKWK